jgi:hypothetical protein
MEEGRPICAIAPLLGRDCRMGMPNDGLINLEIHRVTEGPMVLGRIYSSRPM